MKVAFLYVHMGKGASLSETCLQNCTLWMINVINARDRLASTPVVLKSMMMPSGHYFLSQCYYRFTKLMEIFQSSPMYLRFPSLPYPQTLPGWTTLFFFFFSCHSIGPNISP